MDYYTSTHQEDNLFASSLLASELHLHMSPGETKTQQKRRKKAKGDGGDAKKQRLSDEQVKFLESCFLEEKKLELGRKMRLAAEIGLHPKQVAVWFQNRRAQQKSKQVVDAYAKLKSVHNAIVIEKCHLENEVMVLKEKLTEAEEVIRKLSLGGNGSSSSPSTLINYQPTMTDLGEGELMDMQEYDFNMYMMEYWGYLYGL
ncbi:hypothetical protein Cni_G12668 [Canna indica]|uniref:Homeobox-leucine zipper protein n=1 Tax=Canna indica TaxID=4628 RepID=A0AAQ3K889_9LILI|nr:hypothetical protein Cni_G12668 [Canna indica]